MLSLRRCSSVSLASSCRPGLGVGVALVTFLAACAGPMPELDVPASIRAAAGTEGALEFHTHGEPLDVPDEAAAAAGAAKLTLADAVERAVRHAPELQQALAEVRMAAADAEAARLWANPLLSFVVRWGGGSPQVEASLTESVVQVLQTPTRASAADHRLRAAAAAALTVALDVVAEAGAYLAAAQVADQRLAELEARAAVLARLVAVAESRFRNGEAAAAEPTALQAQQQELAIEVEQARLRAREARLALAHRLGQPGAEAGWELEPLAPVTAELQPERDWLARALTHRPELQQLAWELRALGDEARLATLAPLADAELGAEAEKDPDWAAGPAFSVPLPVFDTGAAGRRRAAAAQAAARHRWTEAGRAVVAEVRTALAALAAQQRIARTLQEMLVPLQQRRLEQAESAWRAGQVELSAVLLAEQDWRAARIQALESLHEARSAELRLHRAAGGAAALAQSVPEIPVNPAVKPASEER